MANHSDPHGICPPPFYQESVFPTDGGYVQGRLCASLGPVTSDQRCCLPCPVADWIYPDNFYSMTRIPGYINCAALGLCAFMLLSLVVLPAKATKRHYLNVCLLLGAVALHLGFVVPWAARPPQCHDQITPNDDTSSMACAWGGGLIVFGGVAINMWILIRALSMHMQICWDIVTGRWFFWLSLAVGWLVSGALLATEMTLSGVSMRFGDYCHVNYHNSLATLWGPLLGLAGVSISLQMATFLYCLHVYLRTLMAGTTDIDTRKGSTGAMSAHSLSGESARAVFIRVRKVAMLQWRGLVIAIILVADVVFFSVIFVVLDAEQQDHLQQQDKIIPWVTCLVTKGNKDECLPLAQDLMIDPNLLIGTLILLSLVGIEVFILLWRLDMFTAWWDLLTLWIRRRHREQEFVSLDAIRRMSRPRRSTSAYSVESIALEGLLPAAHTTRSKAPFVSELTRIEQTDYRHAEYWKR